MGTDTFSTSSLVCINIWNGKKNKGLITSCSADELDGGRSSLTFETHLSSPTRDEGSEGLGKEPRLGEPQAAIHAVGRQLEGLLPDVVLEP